MKRTHWLLALVFIFLGSAPSGAAEVAKYKVLIIRTLDVGGTLEFLIEGKPQLSGQCWFKREDPIPAKTYTGCSAALITDKNPKAITLPDDQTGQKNIAIRVGYRPTDSDGSIVLAPELIEKIYDAIEPKNGNNVTVEVRDVRDLKAQLAKLEKRLKKAMEDPEELKAVIDAYHELGPAGREALAEELKAVVGKMQRIYAALFEGVAKALLNKKIQENRQEIAKIRKFVLEQMHRRDEMTDQEVNDILAQVNRLQALSRLTAQEVRDASKQLANLFAVNHVIAHELDAQLMGGQVAGLANQLGGFEAALAAAERATVSSVGTVSKGARAVPKSSDAVASTDVESETVRLLNQFRVSLGLNPLIIDGRLTAAARSHSTDMMNLGFFSHTSPVANKRDPWDRAKLFDTTAHAENIAKGFLTPAEVTRGWIDSPGHRRNMVGAYSRVAVGIAKDSGGTIYWTQMFGK